MVFIIDWNGANDASPLDDLNLDGSNVISNGAGATVTVDVSTPANPDPYSGNTTEFHLSTAASNIGGPDGELVTGGTYYTPAVTTVAVATGMTNTTFELYDIDKSLTGLGAAGIPWDDLVKVYALDAAGNVIYSPISITNTNTTHVVNHYSTYTSIGATDNADPAVNGSGAADTVTVTIPGLIYGFRIEYTSGSSSAGILSGVVGIGPVSFNDPAYACFTRGTMIETEKGEVAVEDLQEGDLIRTLDNGMKPISWIGSTTVKAQGANAPVLFRKGTIGNTRDLLVSPAHRVMLNDWQAKLLFGSSELLAAAQSLVNDSTIIRQPTEEVEYFHILFDAHEIVFSDGAPTESFHPGDANIGAMAQDVRDEIYRLFPELEQDGRTYGPSARASLRPHEAALLNL